MELKGCGRDKGCFRYCEARPKCPAEEATYMVTIETENSNDKLGANEVLMKIGGYLNDNTTVNTYTDKYNINATVVFILCKFFVMLNCSILF